MSTYFKEKKNKIKNFMQTLDKIKYKKYNKEKKKKKEKNETD